MWDGCKWEIKKYLSVYQLNNVKCITVTLTYTKFQYLTCKVLTWQREASHTQCFKTIAIEKYIHV